MLQNLLRVTALQLVHPAPRVFQCCSLSYFLVSPLELLVWIIRSLSAQTLHTCFPQPGWLLPALFLSALSSGCEGFA